MSNLSAGRPMNWQRPCTARYFCGRGGEKWQTKCIHAAGLDSTSARRQELIHSFCSVVSDVSGKLGDNRDVNRSRCSLLGTESQTLETVLTTSVLAHTILPEHVLYELCCLSHLRTRSDNIHMHCNLDSTRTESRK